MNLIVSLDSGEELQFFPSRNPALPHHPALPLVQMASGRWGTVVFQALQTEGFTIWHARFVIKEDSCLRLRSPIKTCLLYFALKNTFQVLTSAGEITRVKEDQFNFSYVPGIDTRLRFPPGEYAGFGISSPVASLQQLADYHTGLRSFLENAAAGIAGDLSPGYLYASPPMVAAIRNILDMKYLDELSRIYVEGEAWSLLVLSIRLVSNDRDRPYVITAAERALMENVKDWLRANYDDPGDLAGIARRFAINEFRLKRDFKALFDTTVFDYLQHIKMQRAIQLLAETDMSVTEIAYILRYSSVAHFSEAFKKHFGYPPSYLRGDSRSSH